MRNTCRKMFHRFAGDRSGNFTLMFAAGTVAFLLAAGIALDFSRAVSNRSTSRDALDAALLATARELAFGNITAAEARGFLENYLEGTLGVDVGPGKEYQLVNFSIDPVREKISAGLSRDMPLTLMVIGGNKTQAITAGSTVNYGIDETEIVMTFDVTGSMRGSKIADLKMAALSGLNDLMSGSAAVDDVLRIGIVPYSEGVNTGPLYETVFVESEETNGPPPKDTDPILIGTTSPDKCSTERKGPGQFTDDPPRAGKINRDFRLETCPASALIPMTSNKAVLQNAINKMTVGGGTGGHIGIQWAWYLLSPKWADYVPAGSVAGPYDKADLRKFAIIMTDGEFNVAYEGVPKNKSQFNQAAKSMAKAKKLCKNMKAEGIEVFTVGFALNVKSAKDMLKDCASPNTAEMTYYHQADNGNELQKIYRDIATSIKQLRLTK